MSKLENQQLMSNIIHFTYDIYIKNPHLEGINYNYTTDMIINSCTYFYEHIKLIIEHYKYKGANRKIVIVDGQNLSHNINFIKTYKENGKINIAFHDFCDRIINGTASSLDYYLFSENVLPMLLPLIRDDYYYIIVISKRQSLEEDYYKSIIFDNNYVLCNINCISTKKNVCFKDYKNDESDDYLIILLHNLFNYNDMNLGGIMSLDNYSIYKRSLKKILVAEEDMKFKPQKKKYK